MRPDRRYRALLRLSAGELRALDSEGVIEARGEDGYVLSAADVARVAREAAAPGEAYIAQHVTLVSRDVIGAGGGVRKVRGLDPEVVMRKLAALRGPDGAPWLSEAELSAAGKLRVDWAVGEIGLVRGSDWAGAPMGSSPRSASNAQEAAMALRASAWMRFIIEKSPLERCMVSASLRPKRSKTALGSIEVISSGVRPEKMRSSIAISPRTR